jgi:hypothetical protein
VVAITDVLATLAQQRPLFHSEADFQHALAWELHKRMPEASIRLELPLSQDGKLLHIDLWVVHKGRIMAFELKYKTRALVATVGNEQFSLSGHSAQDGGRYDFIKDIQRLEALVAHRPQAVGYAILLTNDSAYWTAGRNVDSVDADFRIAEGRVLHGRLQWKTRASPGTTRGREAPLTIRGSYPLHRAEYAHPATTSYGKLRYLTVEVVPNNELAAASRHRGVLS